MRRVLLAAVAAVAISSGARAQAIVQDPLNLIQNTITSLNSVTTAGEAIKTVRQLVQTYRVVNSHYQAFAHQTDLGGIAMQLGNMSRSYLPEAGMMSDMLGAVRYGGIMGAGNQLLYGEAGRYITSNRLFRGPAEDDFTKEMDSREAVTANAMAITRAGMQDGQDRLAKLELLKARIEAAQDGTEVAAVNGLIEVEKTNLQIHAANVQKVQLMLAADSRVEMQRQDQRRYRDAHELRESTSPLAGSLR